MQLRRKSSAAHSEGGGSKLPTPQLWKWLSRALIDWAIIGLCFAAFHWALFKTAHWEARFLVFLIFGTILGARQHALVILGHDGGHGLITRHRALNDALASLLCFWPLGFSLVGYRRFHYEHHRALGTDNDPELFHKNHRLRIFGIPVFGQWKVPIKPWQFFLTIAGDFVGGSLPHIAMAAYLMRTGSFLHLMAPILFVVAFVGLCWHLDALWVPLVWFGTMGTFFWTIFRLRLWLEHVGTDSTHIVQANALERFLFLPHNTWAHYEHHKYPGVPCWALPALRSASAQPVSVSGLLQSHFTFPRS